MIKTKKKQKWLLQGRYYFQGLPISIENRAGSVRRGKDGDGHKWETKMHYDYGYIRNTEASDGEAVDVYVDKKNDGKKLPYHINEKDPEKMVDKDVYIVHQKKIEHSKKWHNGICPDCRKHNSECKCPQHYDEDKVMLGFDSKDDAIKAYLKQYDSPRFLGPVSTYTLPEFKKTLKNSWGKKLPTKEGDHERWHGVDLDGTLAKDDGWRGLNYIGEPIEKTRKRIEDKLKRGEKVKILTARASDPKSIPPIKEWLKQNNIPLLEITNKKDPGMISMEDDRAIQVRKNTGNLVKAMVKTSYYLCLEKSFLVFNRTDKTSSNDTKFPSRYDIGEFVIFIPEQNTRIKAIINKVIFSSEGKVIYDLIGLKDNASIDGIYSQRVVSPNTEELDSTDIKEITNIREMMVFGKTLNEERNKEGVKLMEKSQRIFRESKNIIVPSSKSMLGTAESAGEPGVMFSMLKENIRKKPMKMYGDGTGKTKVPYTMSESLKEIEQSYESNKQPGETIDDYTRRRLRDIKNWQVKEMLERGQSGTLDKGCGMKKGYQSAPDLNPMYLTMQDLREKADECYRANRLPGEEKNEYMSRAIKEIVERQSFIFNDMSECLAKAYVKAHMRAGKKVGPYFTKTKKKVADVRHKKLTRVDYGGKEAKSKIESLHKKKEHHDKHITVASEMRENVKNAKKAGDNTFMVGDKEHHIDKVMSDLNDHIEHHTNEKRSHDNHIRKIEKRRQTESRFWEKKRGERKAKEQQKKESKGYGIAKDIIKATLGTDKVKKSDVYKVMEAAKKVGGDSYVHMNNYLQNTYPDLKDEINDAGVTLDYMMGEDQPERSEVIKEMLEDGQHEGEKFDEDMIGVLERMKVDEKPEKVKPEIKLFTPKDSMLKPISDKDKEGNEIIVNFSPIIKILKPKQKTKIGSLELTRENVDSYTLSKGKEKIFLLGRKDVEDSIGYYNQHGKLPEQPKGLRSISESLKQPKKKGDEKQAKTKEELKRKLTPDEVKRVTNIEKMGDSVRSIQFGTMDGKRVTRGGMNDTGWRLQPKISELVAARTSPGTKFRKPKQVVVPKEKEIQYTIERYEPNPHQSKEAMLKNRTYQSFRWKELERFKGTEKEAKKYFHSKGLKGEYRIKEHFSDKVIAKPARNTA